MAAIVKFEVLYNNKVIYTTYNEKLAKAMAEAIHGKYVVEQV